MDWDSLESENVDSPGVDFTNGKLSFENPNYHLDPERLADLANSNLVIQPDLEHLYEEFVRKPSTNKRRARYAALDVQSMGVDVDAGPITQLDAQNNRTGQTNTNENDANDNNISLDNTVQNCLTSPDMDGIDMADTSSIPHIQADLSSDLYALPVKKREKTLPPGWEKHEDNDGPYYWHIKSGTIQRDPPASTTKESRPKSVILDSVIGDGELINTGVPRSLTAASLSDLSKQAELALKRRSYPPKIETDASINKQEQPIRFAVRSLGWVEIAEDDLTPERSSKAVNRCIVDLSLGRNDILDGVGRWGDGKELWMELDDSSLKLVDPESCTVLNTQPIHTIRVWGVGRDNGRERDFAYVARDRTTRKHMCHVFRCDMPARTIANTLRDICKRIMIQRSLNKSVDSGTMGLGNKTNMGPTRPTQLSLDPRRRSSVTLGGGSFPTPMEEPKKVLKAQYLGCIDVDKATGMDTLNDSIERLLATDSEQWPDVHVSVAPSTITITQAQEGGALIGECRVRFLSFLGIGKDVRTCAFIMHTAQSTFQAHVFRAEPSSGALCKTIEAACKLRYQKCLDAHGPIRSGANTPGRGLGATIKSVLGSITGRRTKSTES